jgi:hypothetical protein
MSESAEPLDDVEFLFLRKENAGTTAVLWTIGGCVAVGLAVLGFAVSLVTRPNQFALHAMTTLPTLLAIGALSAAWRIARSPRQVTVGSNGLTIDNRNGAETYDWSRIGWATVGPGVLNQRRQLVVYDVHGKLLVTISDAFDDFDQLTEIVKQRIEAKGDDTADHLQRRKSKRSALFLAGTSVGLLALAAVNLWMVQREQRAERLLAESAVPGDAEIVRRFLAPDGVTTRLEYRVMAPDGTQGTRNAEVTRDYWDSLEGATTVPVKYVAADPSISRLTTGEVSDDDLTKRPAMMYGLSAVLAVICLFLMTAAVLQWRGWDIDLDSKTGKISIKRFGTGR